MILTKQRSIRDPEAFPTTQFFLLAIVRLAEPIALTSIFPYAWALVKRFEVGDEKDASFYAGLLISSFSLAEALTGMQWGCLSDKIGRKPVLLLGCLGTTISMVMVGFASNIWFALLGRALGGLLNGNIAVIQTMCGELVKKKEHEPRAYSVMPFVWSIGTILGPMIGGTLADPSLNFPKYFSPTGLFGRFPYLLPNLICAALLLMSIVAGYFLLEETHPDMQPRSSMPDHTYVSDETPLMAAADAIKVPPVDLRAETYGTFNGSPEYCESEWRNHKSEDTPTVFTKRVIAILVALGIFSYHSMTFDHLLPIFLEDDRSSPITSALYTLATTSPTSPPGLGFSMATVGIIMSVNGVLALIVQVVIFPLLATVLGCSPLFALVTLLGPLPYLLMPALPHLPSSLLYPILYGILGLRNFLQIIAYPLLLILLKEATTSPGTLGRINGAAASVGAACRTAAPPVAGWLYTLGASGSMGGGVWAWFGSAAVAAVGAAQLYWIVVSKVLDGGDLEWSGGKDIVVVSVDEIGCGSGSECESECERQ